VALLALLALLEVTLLFPVTQQVALLFPVAFVGSIRALVGTIIPVFLPAIVLLLPALFWELSEQVAL